MGSVLIDGSAVGIQGKIPNFGQMPLESMLVFDFLTDNTLCECQTHENS